MESYLPNLKKVEIDITYDCTLNCNNCDRCISVVKESKSCDINIIQLEKFISDSEKFNYPWERIRIIGGEPTIHPEFETIVKLFFLYKNRSNKDLNISVCTNGYSNITKRKLLWLKTNYPEIQIENTTKINSLQNNFRFFHMAPCDTDIFNNENSCTGCWITEDCGICLNYSGFYCCSAGASIARIFNYDIGIKNLIEINQSVLINMFNELCSKCGHHKTATDAVASLNSSTEVKISVSWKEAIKNYSGNRLTQY